MCTRDSPGSRNEQRSPKWLERGYPERAPAAPGKGIRHQRAVTRISWICAGDRWLANNRSDQIPSAIKLQGKETYGITHLCLTVGRAGSCLQPCAQACAAAPGSPAFGSHTVLGAGLGFGSIHPSIAHQRSSSAALSHPWDPALVAVELQSQPGLIPSNSLFLAHSRVQTCPWAVLAPPLQGFSQCLT